MKQKFLWGAADASFQSDGKLWNNEWAEWFKETGREEEYLTNSPQFHDHPERILEILQKLHLNAYRFSIDWSYVEPEEGIFSEEAITYYKNLLNLLREHDIEPVVTLHHFVHPLWFTQKKAWEKKENISCFLIFVEHVVNKFKDNVSHWITINEPTTYLRCSYATGIRPPFSKNKYKLLKVRKNFIKAHKQAYTAIHRIYSGKEVYVSMAYAIWPLKEFSKNLFTKVLYKTYILLFDYLVNYSILYATRDENDFIGVNCYSFLLVNSAIIFNFFIKSKEIIFDEYKKLGIPLTYFDIPIDNHLIADIYTKLKKYNKPILITESGIWGDDAMRETFIQKTLETVFMLKKQGAPIIGYLHWTLCDNCEWEEGYKVTCGLSHFDNPSNTLQIKPSGYFYQEQRDTYSATFGQ